MATTGLKREHMNSKSWEIWDGLAEVVGVGVMLPLLPAVGVGRAISRIKQRGNISQVKREYEQARKQMELASKRTSDFLATYLKRLQTLHATYAATNWASLADAERGYELLKVAEAALMAEATLVIQENLPG